MQTGHGAGAKPNGFLSSEWSCGFASLKLGRHNQFIPGHVEEGALLFHDKRSARALRGAL